MASQILFIFLVFVPFCELTVVNLRASTSPEVQQRAVLDLIRRILPGQSANFTVKIDPNLGPPFRNTFILLSLDEQTISIEGNDGVAAAWGFHYYLTQFCNCHISWEGSQLNLPTRLPPLPAAGVRVTSNDQFRYYSNVCTFSYSFVWWNWTRWERHIDWMAMNSINLPLAFTGQEAIWRNVYLKLGFTQQDLDVHFAGPAFLAWSRMGNLRTWAGPLPVTWYDVQLQLQKRVVARMRELGMVTVLPGFAGHVPEAILRVFPGAHVSRLGEWSKFNATYSATLQLDPRVPLFQVIGNMFVNEMIAQFGTDHVYNADPFNEMTPASADPDYLRMFALGVYNAMNNTDPKAVWMLQGWMFDFSKTYWQPPQVHAFLTAIPRGKMLILDLYSEMYPQYQRYESYYGQPFIWCMLLNFGGALGHYGNLETLNSGPMSARQMPNSSMVGLGLTMEGISQNYVMYDFLLQQSWRNVSVDIPSWMAIYSRRRYNLRFRELEFMWQNAASSVYNCTQTIKDHGQFILVRRPSLHMKPFIWYSPRSLRRMWRAALSAVTRGADRPLYRYDLVDVTRQALDVAAIKLYADVVNAYQTRNITALTKAGASLLKLLDDLDAVLGSNEHFLLGKWLADAKSLGVNAEEKALYEFNARNQITLWGPDGQIVDYAKKQWSGLVSNYYRPRWQLFLTYLARAVESGQKYNQDVFRADVLANVERPFSYDTTSYPATPSGDTIDIALRLNFFYEQFLTSNVIPTGRSGALTRHRTKKRYVERSSHNHL